jgi:A/G-specific adenine glycosylase
MGIWGGLLSLPELDRLTAGIDASVDAASSEEAIARAAMPFGTLASCERLQPFSHGFTHFKLHVAPYRVGIVQRRELAGQFNYVWYPVENLMQAPLPAPVKKLLLAVFREADLLTDNG